jgi:hypothetical protein
MSREGVAQGDPLAMALYGITLLPLIEHLRAEFPDVLQPWYADDGVMHGQGSRVAPCFQELCRAGPMFGYYPEVEKSIVICPLGDQPCLKVRFHAAGMKVKWRRGHRYVGGHVSSMAMLTRFVEPKVADWVHAVEVLARIAVKYPQSVYAGLTMSLQAEWQHLSRAVPGVEGHLQPIEDAIQGKFIPALMGLTGAETFDNDMRALFANSVKQGGLNLRDPVVAAPRHRQSSLEGSAVLVKSLRPGGELDSVEHQECTRRAGRKARKLRIEGEKALVAAQLAAAPKRVQKRLKRIGCGETGS